MKMSDLSARARATVEKIARAKNMTRSEVLRHIAAISSGRRVSKHSVISCAY